MTMTDIKRHYTGDPNTEIVANKWQQLPKINLDQSTNPAFYVAPQGLVAAVNVALELGLPLLLTGEPGVGKSSLARSLNRELGYDESDLLHFTVKSDTRDSELFYNYDTLGRFHAVHGIIESNLNKEVSDTVADGESEAEQEDLADARRFIRYQALGMAILLAKGRENIPPHIMTKNALAKFNPERRRAVVLIDEIDKAPRDMPNDILNEIERMEFRIPELFRDEKICLDTEEDKRHRPIVIITSNSERELPEAFLRRCLYYDLSMPKFSEDLAKENSNDVSIEAIVASRLGPESFEGKSDLLKDALSLFRYFRSEAGLNSLQRKPSLAELLDWLRYLAKSPDTQTLIKRPDLEISLKTTLFKNKSDQNNFNSLINAWLAQPGR